MSSAGDTLIEDWCQRGARVTRFADKLPELGSPNWVSAVWLRPKLLLHVLEAGYAVMMTGRVTCCTAHPSAANSGCVTSPQMLTLPTQQKTFGTASWVTSLKEVQMARFNRNSQVCMTYLTSTRFGLN